MTPNRKDYESDGAFLSARAAYLANLQRRERTGRNTIQIVHVPVKEVVHVDRLVTVQAPAPRPAPPPPEYAEVLKEVDPDGTLTSSPERLSQKLLRMWTEAKGFEELYRGHGNLPAAAPWIKKCERLAPVMNWNRGRMVEVTR